MPTPLSSIVSVFDFLSPMMRMRPLKPPEASSVSLMNRFLSHASDALLTSSRRKMSLSEYKLLMMISITLLTSASNSYSVFSAVGASACAKMSPDVRFGDAGAAVAALLEAEREPLAAGGREDGTKPFTAAARQAADTSSEKVLMIGCESASARAAFDDTVP